VRWYLRYALSYRDLEEMLAERGLTVEHTTIFRWVQHYALEIDQRSRPHLKPTNDSWRVDETYVKGSSRWMYLSDTCERRPVKYLNNIVEQATGLSNAQSDRASGLGLTQRPGGPFKATK
jgi:transposase-like protein